MEHRVGGPANHTDMATLQHHLLKTDATKGVGQLLPAPIGGVHRGGGIYTTHKPNYNKRCAQAKDYTCTEGQR